MSRYAAAHENPQGAGDARPTAMQVIADEQLHDQMTDKVFLITGCSAGLGIETARALAATGATLYLTARNLPKATAALGDLVGRDTVHLIEMDMASLASVRAGAEAFLAQSKTLNVLIGNAGVMATPEDQTADGFELQFGTNHLSHFLLVTLLADTLLASSTPGFHSRVVLVSSSGHRRSEVHFDNLSLAGAYDPMVSYGQSKTANIWTANEIERRYGARGLHGLSLHPGGILGTGLGQHLPAAMAQAFQQPEMMRTYKSAEQGAATSVWAAVGRELEGTGGKYLDCVQVAPPYDPSQPWWTWGYAPWAYSPEKETRLWEVSRQLVRL